MSGLRRRSASSARVASSDTLRPHPVNRTAAPHDPRGRRTLVMHFVSHEPGPKHKSSERDGQPTLSNRNLHRRILADDHSSCRWTTALLPSSACTLSPPHTPSPPHPNP